MHFLSPITGPSSRPHRLVNATRSIVLAEVVEGAFDSNTRRRGLLGRSSLPEQSALIIAPSSAIHTFGMKFAIDAVFVNRRGEILKRVTALKPRRIAARPGAFAVIEFCARHPGVARCARGDVLVLALHEGPHVGSGLSETFAESTVESANQGGPPR